MHLIQELKLKNLDKFILILKILMMLNFLMVSLKTRYYSYELFLSDRDYFFDQDKETFIRNKLRENAKKKYENILKNDRMKRLKRKITLLLILDLKKRRCIKVKLLSNSL